MTPPQPNATKNKIENEVENAWASFVPQLNGALAAHPIALPVPAGAHSPAIIYGNGYVQIQFKTGDKAGEVESTPGYVDLIDPAEIDPANVFDIAGGLEKEATQALTPAMMNMVKLAWATAFNVPEEELLSYGSAGYPAGRALPCPNIPKFGAC